MQISNIGPNVAGPYAYASVTLKETNNYWEFGNQWSGAIAPGANALWGTLPSSQDTPGVTHSSNLDNLFSYGNTSFEATIQINTYANQNDLGKSPTQSFKCRGNPTYMFNAGHTYNIMVNPVTGDHQGSVACDIKLVN